MKRRYNKRYYLISEFVDNINQTDEPLDGDAVDELVWKIKCELNLHEGNITESEYRELKRYKTEQEYLSKLNKKENK